MITNASTDDTFSDDPLPESTIEKKEARVTVNKTVTQTISKISQNQPNIGDELSCYICMEPKNNAWCNCLRNNNFVKPCNCNHWVCNDCLENWLRTRKDNETKCEVCLCEFIRKDEYDIRGCVIDTCYDNYTSCLTGHWFIFLNFYVMLIINILLTVLLFYTIVLLSLAYTFADEYGSGLLWWIFGLLSSLLIIMMCFGHCVIMGDYVDGSPNFQQQEKEQLSQCMSVIVILLVLVSLAVIITQFIGMFVVNWYVFNDPMYEFYPRILTFGIGMVVIVGVIMSILSVGCVGMSIWKTYHECHRCCVDKLNEHKRPGRIVSV
jgi:hypothetical protein